MIKLRKLEEYIAVSLSFLSLVIVTVFLLSIIAVIFIKGIGSLSWEIISQTPKGGFYLGKGGGVLNSIIGSLYLSLGAVILAVLLSLPVVLFLNVYLLNKKAALKIRFIIDVLAGIPSIVYGAAGLTVMFFLKIPASLGAGIITLSVLIFPIICRGIDEVFKMIPREMLDSAYALGFTRFEVSCKVLLKQAFPGIITAVLIAFGRAFGDAACVMFTAGFSDHIPQTFSDPAASLPLSIFYQLGSPIEEVRNRAFASSVILVGIIFIISLITNILKKMFKNFLAEISLN